MVVLGTRICHGIRAAVHGRHNDRRRTELQACNGVHDIGGQPREGDFAASRHGANALQQPWRVLRQHAPALVRIAQLRGNRCRQNQDSIVACVQSCWQQRPAAVSPLHPNKLVHTDAGAAWLTPHELRLQEPTIAPAAAGIIQVGTEEADVWPTPARCVAEALALLADPPRASVERRLCHHCVSTARRMFRARIARVHRAHSRGGHCEELSRHWCSLAVISRADTGSGAARGGSREALGFSCARLASNRL